MNPSTILPVSLPCPVFSLPVSAASVFLFPPLFSSFLLPWPSASADDVARDPNMINKKKVLHVNSRFVDLMLKNLLKYYVWH